MSSLLERPRFRALLRVPSQHGKQADRSRPPSLSPTRSGGDARRPHRRRGPFSPLYTSLSRCHLPHQEGWDASRCTHLSRWHPRARLGGSPPGSQGLPCLRTVGCVARVIDRCARALLRRNGWWLSTSVGGHDLQRPPNPRPRISLIPQRTIRIS